MARYEMASKFWDGAVTGKQLTVRFGKLGATGQTQVKEFASELAAKTALNKLIAEKTGKGYRPGGGELARASTPPAPERDAPVHARDARLEAAIARTPDDPAGYLVYADWLEQQGDPRGELVALHHAGKRKQADKLLARHAEHFFGEVAATPQRLVAHPHAPLGRPTTWRWGYLEAIWLSRKHDDGNAPTVADALAGLLDHPSAAFVRELTIGIVSYDGNTYAEIAKAIGKRPRPTLRRLVIGDFHPEETELNWSQTGNLAPIWKAVPALDSLVVRSGRIALGAIALPDLRELSIICGDLERAALMSIVKASWPRVERASIQLGRNRAIRLADLQPIFDGKVFPSLFHLGLGNTLLSDGIARALAASKIAARLESLDLSEGALGDDGATALAAGRFPALKRIDVRANNLIKLGLASLADSAGVEEGKLGVHNDSDTQAEDRDIAGY